MKKPAVRVVDKGWTRIVSEIKRMKVVPPSVHVGLLGESGERNIEVGIFNEFGTATSPARSFLRSSVTMNREKYQAMIAKGYAKFLQGKTTFVNVFNTVGIVAVNDIKNQVTVGEGIPPPNAPATIAAKGSDRTLIDTAQMINSVTHEVKGG